MKALARSPRHGLALALWVIVSAGAGAAQQLKFLTSPSVSLSGVPGDILIADCNADARADVFVSLFNRRAIAVVLNAESGLMEAVDTPGPVPPDQLTAGDFDSDGILDIVASETESDFIYLMRGSGDGSFGAPESVFVDHDPAGVFAADMNRDGNLDVLLSTASEGGGVVNVLLGNGDGTFDYDPERARRVSAQAYDVVAGDLDGDGNLDAVAACLDGNLAVLLGNGDGTLNRVQLHPGGEQLFRVDVADVDGDGDLDAMATAPMDLGLSLFRGDGAGGFGDAERLAVGPSPSTVRLVDLDGDDIVDAVTGNPASGDVSVLRGRPDGSYAAARHYLAPLRPFVADALDVDDDGHADLLAGSQAGSGGELYVVGGRDGGFAAIEAQLHGTEIAAIEVADLDDDGRLEWVIGSTAQRAVLVVERDRDGGVLEQRPVLVDAEARALALADLDGDAHLDMVAALGSSAIASALGRGDGTFAEPAMLTLSAPAVDIAIADFDGDGAPDVAAASGRSNSPAVLIAYGLGDGQLAEPVALPLDRTPYRILSADFDGDGNPDLAVAGTSGASITLLAGNGDRTFAAPLALPTSVAPLALAGADFDDDGNVDLVYGGQNTVQVLYGGDGFSPGPLLPAAGTIVAVRARDLTGDLRPDLAAISQTNSALFAYANLGGRGAFGQPVGVALGLNPALLATADVDADGRYDAAAVGGALWAVLNDGAASPARGDGNGDARLGAADLTALAGAARPGRRVAIEEAADHSAGIDANGDGWVDGGDLRVLPRLLFAGDE